MPNDDAQLEALIRSTFSTLDDWHTALRELYTPPAGSVLATDDDDWAPHRLSQVAVGALGSARDHLEAVRVHFDAKAFFPYAQSTLVRSALIAAAEAVWVLAPEDRVTRLGRARCVAEYSLDQHRKYLNVLRSLPDTPHENTELVTGFVTERLGQLREVRVAAGEGFELNTTSMIAEAAEATFVDKKLVAEIDAVWRRASGAAHGLQWPLYGAPGLSQVGEVSADGTAAFTAAGAVKIIANSYMAAFYMARKGWELLELRSGSTEPTV